MNDSNLENFKNIISELLTIGFNDGLSAEFNVISPTTLIINIFGKYSYLFNLNVQKDLQKIIRLMFINDRGLNTNTKFKIIVDTENKKSKNIEFLKTLAKENAEKVLLLKRSIGLNYMNAFERYIIHDYIAQNYPQLTTKSIGKEPRRKVIISIKSNGIS